MFAHAIVRRPCPNFAAGETTVGLDGDLGRPDLDMLLTQHEAYVRALERAGLTILELPTALEFPDAHFVEDAAVIVPELAILTRPGAPSRRDEPALLEPALASMRLRTARIEAPGTLDGGDVLQVGKHVMVGLSERTNKAGVDELARFLTPFGYRIEAIAVGDSLHLKSDANFVAQGTLVVTSSMAQVPALSGYDLIVVDDSERYAANCLRVNKHLLVASGFPDTTAKLATLDAEVITVDASECRKMDGGLTCMSLRF